MRLLKDYYEWRAVYTCVLNSNISSDDVQWYRFIKDTRTTVRVNGGGDINFVNHTKIHRHTYTHTDRHTHAMGTQYLLSLMHRNLIMDTSGLMYNLKSSAMHLSL